MSREKTSGIYFKVSEQERKKIKRRMELAGIQNMSAYIRKMCLDGTIILIDIPELPVCSKYLRSVSNNLNQIARRVNSGGGYYPDEIQDLTDKLTVCSKLFGNIMERLSAIR